MKKETCISSMIGQTLAPDFSEEKDLGEALYSHMQNLTPLLRAAKTVSNSGEDGSVEDLQDLLELFEEGFEKCLEEFDAQRTGRNHAVAAKGPAEKNGKARKAA